MATADFDLSITINSNTEDTLKLLEVIKKYENGEKGVYFNFLEADIDGEEIDFDDLSSLEVEGEVNVTAMGPYGRYTELNDVDLFRDMAEIAPRASFEAEITGCTSYTEQSLNCHLEDGILHISTYFESNEEGQEAYVEYFTKQLPYEKFIELFKIEDENFDEDYYCEFIDNVYCYSDEGIADIEFEDLLAELDVEVGIDEDEYKEIVNNLDIQGYYEFAEDCDVGFEEELDYDPLLKKYINTNKPLIKSNEVVNVNEQIREYLKENGFAYDDETISNLTVEDVYAIMAGTYRKE